MTRIGNILLLIAALALSGCSIKSPGGWEVTVQPDLLTLLGFTPTSDKSPKTNLTP